MFRRLNHRPGHYALLLLLWALLCLPNLGGPSLWDIDEGNNFTAAWEMKESGNYVVPTFNNHLRVDKPVLLYWLQTAACTVFGVNEFAARLPSALAALLAVLATYELGRRMFDRATGLLAGVILVGAVCFCAAAHFANPDALLTACTVLTLLCFWCDYQGHGRPWFVATGLTAGLGMLAKGPVGVILPMATTMPFLLWRRRLWASCDRRLLGAILVFMAIALPWYAWVGVETKGKWLTGFFIKHNWERATQALEHHSGPFYYYLLVLCVGLAPWSIFLGLTIWSTVKELRARAATANAEEAARTRDPKPALQLLVGWVLVYLAAFSIARTKLPNYVMPLYPAAALLLARFLERWRRGQVQPAAWTVQVSVVCLGLIGMGVAGGLLLAGGVVPLRLLRGRSFPALAPWALLGLVPLLAAGVAAWCVWRQRRGTLIVVVAVASVLFVGPLAGWGVMAVDEYKAPRPLTASLPPDLEQREIRVASFGYFQPSLVFYCQREIKCLEHDYEIQAFLQGPLPSYLFVPATLWGQLTAQHPYPGSVLARHHDLYQNREVLLITNAAGLAGTPDEQRAQATASR
jgi:4-amino-4-deoxy-L-arabinose transferase-like glycosyltransferase